MYCIRNLGELPEVNFDNLSAEEQNKIKEQKPETLKPSETKQTKKPKIENSSEPKPEKLHSPHESLPKNTGRELSQELELTPEPEPEAIPEPEPEATPEQLARLAKLEKQIEELESNNLEKKLIQKLEQENKKLDQIESNLNNTGKIRHEPNSKNDIEAYCVKCKQKRIIDNSQETTMKNGRNAVKGTVQSVEPKFLE